MAAFDACADDVQPLDVSYLSYLVLRARLRALIARSQVARRPRRVEVGDLEATMGLMGGLRSPRYIAAAIAATLATAAVTGIPTDLLPNPWFTRMTPVRPLDAILWPLISLAVGALLATYVLPRARSSKAVSTGAGSGLAGTLAVGCPICNKLVVAALGTSGALTYFAPLQPILGIGALLVTVWALRRRITALSGSCELTPAAPRPAPTS